MSDIDFDELDREVKKLVTNDSSQDDAPESAEINNAHDENTTDEISPTSLESSDTELSKSDEDTTTDDQKSTKPRGRFMDVVHPSSDMAAGDEELGARLTSQNERKSLTPVHEVEEVKRDLPEAETKQPPKDGADMPDPIDFHEQKNAQDGDMQNADEVEKPAELDMPSSAFLADAKVEKRPLGQHSESGMTDASKEGESDEKKDDAPVGNAVDDIAQKAIDEANGKTEEDKDKTAPVEENVPLPPELEKDLVAIEAGQSPDEILSGTSDENEEVEKPDAAEQNSPEDKNDDTDNDDTKSDSHTAAILSSGSIPQQYKIALQQKTGDESAKQLFAAEHYTTTPTKAAKKGASTFATVMQWFFIVVGVLLLGAVIGAGLYTFVSNQ